MTNWVDRVIGFVAPRAALRRLRARQALDLVARHYEASSGGRRTEGWSRRGGDANAAISGSLDRVRTVVRDMVRNNPWIAGALEQLASDCVGWGIVAGSVDKRAMNVWKGWAETTACDVDGRQNIYGLQKQAFATAAEAGECLVRRWVRPPSDDRPLPLQLQLLEPDYLDTMRDGQVLPDGNRIIEGVEIDTAGQRVAYWLFRQHPGAHLAGARDFGLADRVPAEDILHIAKPGRPGQVRAISWFAPAVLTAKDLDVYEDAQLVKQQVAACLGIAVTDLDGSAAPLGQAGGPPGGPEKDRLEPGMILNLPVGRSIETIDPPTVGDYDPFVKWQLRKIAAPLGLTYEDLTGDFTGLPFSAARMSRLRKWSRVDGWRWNMLIPQFCDPVWRWAMEAAVIMGQVSGRPAVTWTAPAMPMIDPGAEGLAYARNIRAGITSLSEVLRERGYNPEELLKELAADFKRLDDLGLILDSDPRRTTQAGQPFLMPLAELAERVDALGVLIRAGYDPVEALAAVGLPKIKHTGATAVTVQPEPTEPPAPSPDSGEAAAAAVATARALEQQLEWLKGRLAPAGNRTEPPATARDLAELRASVDRVLEAGRLAAAAAVGPDRMVSPEVVRALAALRETVEHAITHSQAPAAPPTNGHDPEGARWDEIVRAIEGRVATQLAESPSLRAVGDRLAALDATMAGLSKTVAALGPKRRGTKTTVVRDPKTQEIASTTTEELDEGGA